MNSNRRTNRAFRRSKRLPPGQQKMVNLLTSIDQKQTMQERGIPPEVPDVPRLYLKPNKIYSIAKTVSKGTITSSTAADVLTSYTFSLADTADSSAYGVVWDSWRIAQVTIKIIPVVTNTSVGSSLFSALDYDDSNAVTVAGLLQYDTLMQTQAGQLHVRTLNPRIQVAVYAAGAAVPAMASRSQWCDVSSSNTFYYGVKVGLPAVPTGTTPLPIYGVYADILYQFTGTR